MSIYRPNLDFPMFATSAEKYKIDAVLDSHNQDSHHAAEPKCGACKESSVPTIPGSQHYGERRRKIQPETHRTRFFR
jgi:hypothetical protein